MGYIIWSNVLHWLHNGRYIIQMTNIAFNSYSSFVFPLPQILHMIKFKQKKKKTTKHNQQNYHSKTNTGVKDSQKHLKNITSVSILYFNGNYFYLDILQLPEQLDHVVAVQGEEENQTK